INNDQLQSIESIQTQLQELSKALERIRNPATKLKLNLLKLKGFMPRMANPKSMELGISTQMFMDGSNTKRGFFKSCRINMGIKLNTHTAKKEKQLLEARQQVIDFSSIGIHIKELSRGFSQIKNPVQDLPRLALVMPTSENTLEILELLRMLDKIKIRQFWLQKKKPQKLNTFFIPKPLNKWIVQGKQLEKTDCSELPSATDSNKQYRSCSSQYTGCGETSLYRGNSQYRGGY
ncbi:hypothetical protein BB559_005762, partial [Furculomyces boomerangus]